MINLYLKETFIVLIPFMSWPIIYFVNHEIFLSFEVKKEYPRIYSFFRNLLLALSLAIFNILYTRCFIEAFRILLKY